MPTIALSLDFVDDDVKVITLVDDEVKVIILEDIGEYVVLVLMEDDAYVVKGDDIVWIQSKYGVTLV